MLVVLVVMLVSYLVFFLMGLAYGLATSYTTAIDKWNASGIILNKDANNTLSRSLLTEEDYKDILGNDAAPLGVGVATIRTDEPEDVSLFGIDTDSFLAPQLSSGQNIASNSDVLVSEELGRLGVELNSALTFRGGEQEYKVVGFVRDASFQAAPVVYMTLEAWRQAVSDTSGMGAMRDATTVSAIVTRGDERGEYTTDRMSWQTIRDFTFSLPGYQPQVLTFSLMISFLIGIATLVLAIFIYILTLQKKSIFGVLKAEGVPSRYIGRSVMIQVVLLSLCGLVLGMVLAIVTGLLLQPKVPFQINLLFFAGIIALFLSSSIIGGIASVRSVAKIDPVEAIG